MMAWPTWRHRRFSSLWFSRSMRSPASRGVGVVSACAVVSMSIPVGFMGERVKVRNGSEIGIWSHQTSGDVETARLMQKNRRTIGGMKTIRLREGKERSLLRRHPWIFESAIAKGGADAGETVRVESHAGEFLAWAAFSPESKIRARAWSFDENQRIDAALFAAKVTKAIQARARFDIQSDGMRLIHGESDGLPGLVVDRYGDTLVAQFLSSGVERWKTVLVDALMQTTGLSRLYERSDTNARQLEGLMPATGWLRGSGPTELILREHEWQLGLDIATGHKTGFYLDQRDSRRQFCEHARRLNFERVLNCFCYTGGFTVAALQGGARH